MRDRLETMRGVHWDCSGTIPPLLSSSWSHPALYFIRNRSGELMVVPPQCFTPGTALQRCPRGYSTQGRAQVTSLDKLDIIHSPPIPQPVG